MNFFKALIPLVTLIILLSINVYIFGQDAITGPSQMALILSAAVAAGLAFYQGYTWEVIERGIVKSISTAMPAILILLMIGALAGTWLLSGIIPTMIYYGLKILNPTSFLPMACIICVIVSVATGSSWSTIATIGVALFGVGKALGWPEGVVAGAIISGAYFGDKISPLSDATNLASSVTRTPLFRHISYAMITAIPSLILALVIFGVMGLTKNPTALVNDTTCILQAIEKEFYISFWLFIVPLIVVVMIIKKIPAFPVLLTGALLGGIFAVLFQSQMILQVADSSVMTFRTLYTAILKAMYTTIGTATGNTLLDTLLSSQGMRGMLPTIWLILAAMMFGGVMEVTGMLTVLTEKLTRFGHSTGALAVSTTGACVFFNLTTSDQYLSILVPGKMYAPLYKKQGLAPENLSRTLGDAATVTSPLIPWNSCGAMQSTILGVATLTYLPYCFFNIINPLMAILFGYLGISIAKISQ